MNDGGPAFPVPELLSSEGRMVHIDYAGMTLRDYFAAKAMQGFLASGKVSLSESNWIKVAKSSYAMADAFIAERA